MKSVFVISLALLLAFVSASGASAVCKCVYPSSCWPSADEFASLATKLSQPLVYPKPPEAACYPANATSVSVDCATVTEHYYNGNWRADQSGAMQGPNFEMYIQLNSSGQGTLEACYLNSSLGIPCEQGNVPVIGVDARTVGDIQEAVNFATLHNLKVVIKNTGHDFVGRSTAKGSFLIWTHNMKNITYDDAFSPLGAPANETYNAITLGAGVQWHEAYDAANEHGALLVGGLVPGGSVGAAGGWLMGGGHSALSPSYGLGVDNVLQFSVVTSTGEFLTVSSYSHPDLFWALRGGGGGTFGVVTSATYRTHPSVPAATAILTANATDNAVLAKLLSEYIRRSPTWSDQGWGGYGTVFDGTLEMLHVAPNVSLAAANASYSSFFEFAQSLVAEGLNLQTTVTLSYPTYYDWYQTYYNTSEQDQETGTTVLLGSRLMTREVIESNYTTLGQWMVEDFVWSQLVLIAGGAVNRTDPDAMGLNPAWRTALAEVLTAMSWPDTDNVTEIQSAKGTLKEMVSALDSLNPGSGAYLNEDYLEDNWQHTFFGSHYPRLKAIKATYDPMALFVVRNGVDSEDWDADLICPV